MGNVVTNSFCAVNEGIDFLDENVPSWCTATGSVRGDIDAAFFALSVMAPEIAVWQQASTIAAELRSAGAAGSEGKSIVLGEGMGRVKDAAKTLQADGVNAKWYQAWSKNFPTDRAMTPSELSSALARNERWLTSKIKDGYQIFDIGIDATRATRSPFYQLEQSILQKFNYPVTPLVK